MSAPQHHGSQTVPTLSVLEAVQYLRWSNHARNRVEARPGLTYSYVDDVILQPYGRIYWEQNKGCFVLFDPDENTPVEKPRTVVTAVEGRTATVITAYNVDDPQMYEAEARFILRGIRIDRDR